MYFILDSLLIGNFYEAQDPPPFINALLWASADQRLTPPDKLTFACIPLKEYAEADPIDLEAGVDWVDRHLSSHRVLVCCRAGLGRSVSIVIAYLCCVNGMSYEEAMNFVKARRPGATPIPNLEKTIQMVCEMRQRKSDRS